jgi:hypothetical protein
MFVLLSLNWVVFVACAAVDWVAVIVYLEREAFPAWAVAAAGDV